jgi:dTDP-4-dehydrorhamnose reductase
VRILVTGAAGQVGSEVVLELERRRARRQRGPELEIIAADHATLDVRDRDAVLTVVTTVEPDVIIHPAAFTAVDRCESEPDLAFAVNAFGTRHLAEAAGLVRAHLAYVSTDYVFDGRSPSPYTEWDTPNPLSVYGRSKLGGERELGPEATIVRTSWVCGRTGPNMVKTVLRLLEESGPLRFVDDQFGSPTVAADLAAVLVELALGRRRGIFHVTNSGSTNWFGFVQAVAEFAGGDAQRVEPIRTAELFPPRPAPRPANSVLDNLALRLAGHEPLRSWQEATRELVTELTAHE